MAAAFGLVLAMAGALRAEVPDGLELREGDVVFTGSERGQGEAIIAATGSRYTHCGVVFEKDGKLMVLEAVQPVGVVTLEKFMARAEPGTLLARRLKVAVEPEKYRAAREWADAQIGKDYDGRFLWGDEQLYCSELVWRVFKEAGVELCTPRKFRDYDLEKPAVRKIIDERFGGMEKVPLDEKVVAPTDLAVSPMLVDVHPER